MNVKGVTDRLSWTHASWDVMLRVKSCLVFSWTHKAWTLQGPLIDPPPFFLLRVCVVPLPPRCWRLCMERAPVFLSTSVLHLDPLYLGPSCLGPLHLGTPSWILPTSSLQSFLQILPPLLAGFIVLLTRISE